MITYLKTPRNGTNIYAPSVAFRQSKPKQLELIGDRATPDLVVEPVRSEFEGDRYSLNFGDWAFPIELRLVEANRLFDRFEPFDWEIPRDLERIYAIAESELTTLWATLRLIGGGAR